MNKFFRVSLILGVATALFGFILAGFLGYREHGISIFFTGFALTSFSIVASLISSPKATLGSKASPGIKVMALGFGVILVVKLMGNFTGWHGGFIRSILYMGYLAMVIGICLVALRIRKIP